MNNQKQKGKRTFPFNVNTDVNNKTDKNNKIVVENNAIPVIRTNLHMGSKIFGLPNNNLNINKFGNNNNFLYPDRYLESLSRSPIMKKISTQNG